MSRKDQKKIIKVAKTLKNDVSLPEENHENAFRVKNAMSLSKLAFVKVSCWNFNND